MREFIHKEEQSNNKSSNKANKIEIEAPILTKTKNTGKQAKNQ